MYFTYFVNKIERQAIFIIFNTNPRFPHFYYMLGANLGLLLYGEVSVMTIMTDLLRWEMHSWSRFTKKLIEKSRECHSQVENILRKTLIRRRILRGLSWICSVSLCPFYGTLGTYGLIQLDFIASPAITGIFSRRIIQPDSFKLLSAMRKGIRSQNLHIRLVSLRGYKAYPAVHSEMHLVAWSNVLHITVYQKCKQNLSKLLVINISFC